MTFLFFTVRTTQHSSLGGFIFGSLCSLSAHHSTYLFAYKIYSETGTRHKTIVPWIWHVWNWSLVNACKISLCSVFISLRHVRARVCVCVGSLSHEMLTIKTRSYDFGAITCNGRTYFTYVYSRCYLAALFRLDTLQEVFYCGSVEPYRKPFMK